jgi:hypothetical protein
MGENTCSCTVACNHLAMSDTHLKTVSYTRIDGFFTFAHRKANQCVTWPALASETKSRPCSYIHEPNWSANDCAFRHQSMVHATVETTRLQFIKGSSLQVSCYQPVLLFRPRADPGPNSISFHASRPTYANSPHRLCARGLAHPAST